MHKENAAVPPRSTFERTQTGSAVLNTNTIVKTPLRGTNDECRARGDFAACPLAIAIFLIAAVGWGAPLAGASAIAPEPDVRRDATVDAVGRVLPSVVN